MKINTNSKLCNILRLFKHFEEFCSPSNTYYPEEMRKSAFKILKEQIRLVCKYGSAEPYYFLYGFDRISVTKEVIDSYLNFKSFQYKINDLNTQNPFTEYGRFCGRVITADKYYFYLFCSALNIPVIDILLYSKYGNILYTKEKRNVSSDLKSSINELLNKNNELFIKLTGGQLGLGAMLVKQKNREEILINNEDSTIQNLVDRMSGGEFIVQPVLKQHVSLNLLAPYCVNTIRLQTVLKPDGNVMPFGALMRLGRKNSCVDNWAKGGVLVGIDMNTGRLKKYGFLKPGYGGKVLEHPDTLVSLENFLVPYFNEAVYMAVQLHQHLYRCHSVGWDIAITDSGPVFIEGNGLWEISMVQAGHGGLKKMLEDCFNKNSYR